MSSVALSCVVHCMPSVTVQCIHPWKYNIGCVWTELLNQRKGEKIYYEPSIKLYRITVI